MVAEPNCGNPGVSASSRATVMYVLALIAGAVLFFLIFGAVFVGAWPLLIVFLLCYAAAGAIGVRKGTVPPGSMALALAAPSVPWVLWLFPASVAEEGLVRALPWPGFAVAIMALAWLGGTLAARPIYKNQKRPADQALTTGEN
jgi:hypothetical protein